jgi:hypothetical protein
MVDHQTTVEVEEWRAVPDCGGRYAVSSLGRVKRLVAMRGKRAGHVFKCGPAKNGYVQAHLFVRGRARTLLVHHIVAAAFIGDRPPGYEINHKDRDKTNNRAGNLEYLTKAANVQHAVENGAFTGRRVPIGVECGQSKATPEIVRAIRLRYAHGGISMAALGRAHALNPTTVWQIIHRKSWAHVL